MTEALAILLDAVRDIGRLQSVQELLDWDQQVCMPPKGVHARAEQAGLVAGLVHERLTSPRMGDALAALTAPTGDPVADTNVRETRRAYERAVKVPGDLVRELARTSSLAHEAWERARRESDFPTFAPFLERLVDLRRRVAECIGYVGEPYDALLDEYEPGMSTAQVAELFAALRRGLVPLVQAIAEANKRPDASILRRHYPIDAQRELVLEISRAMGFDFEAGRMDVSTHPFTSGACPGDVRLTTRYDDQFLPSALFGAMHEVGHGLYQQGL
ncbi:MAG: carboxypeptidase M32, partial [Phycisphaerae bacterium]|nr:carboxypeptidase M32 [Phycisphaerae bacterium]